ncbi:hypothetical protein HUB94_20490 (plasmid) [Paenibacillus cellulosilyticus]|nr:hypothetical protein [Paenibacillus cellulosilyticus]QKS46864.1 hypothetical protein HUB94_20490 [Paenibacillus cellulosilyticus]
MPSSIAELKESEFKGLFAHDVSQEMLHEQIVISFMDGEKKRYFKVGEKAKADLLGNEHIFKLHDKTESVTVRALWMGGIAFYHAHKRPEQSNETIELGYMGTLVPVWLLKKASSFKEKIAQMEKQFQTQTFELITAGYVRTITINVHQVRCRVEGETARYALKYDLEQNLKEEAKKFKTAYVVIDDIGGQSQDLCKLQPDLGRAQTANDFASVTDQSFLTVLESFRKDKLMDVFSDVRTLETFIYEHVKERKFVYIDPITRKEKDLTAIIEPMLQTFSEYAMQKALQAFYFSYGQTVYYVHIGGVCHVLKFYMMSYLKEALGEDVATTYHIFPEESRKLNIYACEIIAKNEIAKTTKPAGAGE